MAARDFTCNQRWLNVTFIMKLNSGWSLVRERLPSYKPTN